MAINLWKLAGKPTSYNPLPLGWDSFLTLNAGNYVLNFKAKSPSGSKLNIDGSKNELLTDGKSSLNINLTNNFQTYSISISTTTLSNLFLNDLSNKGDIIIESIELIQKPLGSPKRVQTPKRSVKQARTGLVFNGVTDYLQLPSMTMDAIEIECLIDAVQPNTYTHLMDARNGLINGYVLVSNSTADSLSLGAGLYSQSGYLKGQRSKIKIIAPSSFTDDITIFGKFDNTGYRTKGTLYKVTCYLNNQIVAQYDFENPSAVVGDKVLQNPKNLIPSFEDSRWSLHANFKVLGPNVGRLDATASLQGSAIFIDCKPNQKYYFDFLKIDGWYSVKSFSSTGVELTNHIADSNTSKKGEFTSHVLATQVKITHSPPNAGAFDFVRPQLYELTGKEATLYGKPTQGIKAAKRVLYAKR